MLTCCGNLVFILCFENNFQPEHLRALIFFFYHTAFQFHLPRSYVSETLGAKFCELTRNLVIARRVDEISHKPYKCDKICFALD